MTVLLDTHAVIWYFAADARLSAKALAAIRDVIARGELPLVSAITIAEMRYLVEKGTVPEPLFEAVMADFLSPTASIAQAAFNTQCAAAMKAIPRDIVPDMPDRMIAATALHLGVSLVTKDSRIRKTTLATIW